MSTVLTWLQAVFESPEAILCIVYFVIRLIYFLATRKKKKTDDTNKVIEQNEINDIYLATAQLYDLLKKDKTEKTNSEVNRNV